MLESFNLNFKLQYRVRDIYLIRIVYGITFYLHINSNFKNTQIGSHQDKPCELFFNLHLQHSINI